MCGISGHLGVSADEELIERLSRCDHASAGLSRSAPAVARVGSAVLAVTAPGEAADRALATSVSGRHTLVLDGELYDTADLRDELTTLGHELGAGDAALVLAAYAEWGPEGLDRLEGSFALAVHDRDTDAVTLARDPFGTRQLYAARVGLGWLALREHHPTDPRERAPRAPPQRPHDLSLPLLPRARRRSRDVLRGHRAGRRGRVDDADPDGGAERHLWSSLVDELEATRDAPALRRARGRGLPPPAHGGRATPQRPVGWRTSLSGGIDAAAIVAVVDGLARAEAPTAHARAADVVGALPRDARRRGALRRRRRRGTR